MPRPRRGAVLLALLAAGALGACGGDGGEPQRAREPSGPTTRPAEPPPPPPPSGDGRRTVILIGDSLAEGMEEHLPRALPGWRVRSDALTGRPLDDGMAILARTPVPDGAVVAISLFTNDDPTRVPDLEAAVRTSVRRAGRRGCAVWATIAAPVFGGRSFAPANALLRRLDGLLGRRLAVVRWAERAARSGWLSDDRVHATPAGYRARARLYARAARSCR